MGAGATRRPWADERGASAVEFALVLPIMLSIFFGGYVLSDAITIRRKVSITTRTLADLTTQVSSISTSDMATLLATSSEVIAPYNAANLSIRLSEIITDATGLIATVAWSTGLNTTTLTCNQTYTLPTAMYQPNSAYILSEVTYNFVPQVGYALTGTLTLSDSIFMVPRISQTVAYTCPG